MNLQNLFVMQEKLDHHVMKEHDLYGKTLFSEKLLALQVGIADLANETRCFKFWSTKRSSSKDAILEQFIYCLHFILTIGLEKNFTNTIFTLTQEDMNSDITNQFLNLYIDINDFIICSSKDHYETLFQDFLLLGCNLGFTEEEIETAYYRNNTKIRNRQVSCY